MTKTREEEEYLGFPDFRFGTDFYYRDVEEWLNGEGSGNDPEDHCECAGMTEAQKFDQAIDAEVAEVLREILQQTNQNAEYGSLIYIDANGQIQHTPLTAPTSYHAAFNLVSLGGDFSNVVAVVHSHPQYLPDPETGQIIEYYIESSPDRLLRPSMSGEWGGTQGDWMTYDYYAGLVSADGGDANALSFYVIGYDGNSLVINQYGWEDRETKTAASGDPVAADAEACTC